MSNTSDKARELKVVLMQADLINKKSDTTLEAEQLPGIMGRQRSIRRGHHFSFVWCRDVACVAPSTDTIDARKTLSSYLGPDSPWGPGWLLVATTTLPKFIVIALTPLWV